MEGNSTGRKDQGTVIFAHAPASLLALQMSRQSYRLAVFDIQEPVFFSSYVTLELE